MERNGVSEEVHAALRAAFKLLFRGGLNISIAVERIEREVPMSPEVERLLKFVKTSGNGISK